METVTDQIERLTAALADRYRIERELGAGGMATVYLAEDLKHNRKVAVKVLKPELAVAIGAERFLAEIKTTANLQHPHILALHDSGEVNGSVFYVMPYVEGESLRDRLEREKQLPINDAQRIALEVADALQYAHERGVIHRDIKPENILLQRGHAVVADFGIALAASKTGGARMTETGMSLGTPTYMSPEQAMGSREVDARTDIYSLGCVLYEMLAGEPPFVGPTAQSIVAKVITEEPKSITGQRHTVPEHIDDTIRTALEKLPADRFGSAADFIESLKGERASQYSGAHRFKSSHTKRQGMLLWGAAAVAAIVLAGAGYEGGHLTSAAGRTMAAERYLNVVMPDSLPVALSGYDVPLGIWQRAMTVSTDGRVLAYVARTTTGNKLVVRHLDNGQTTALQGTEGAYSPFFSPDDKWIAFFDGTDLKKISVDGGQPVTIATDMYVPTGGVWPQQDRIAVAQSEGNQLVWYSASGGKAERTDTLGIDWTIFPQMLPGGKAAVAHGRRGLKLITFDPVKVFDITMKGVVPEADDTDPITGDNPIYSSSGHLVYASLDDGRLMAVPFDVKSLKVVGAPALVLENVRKEQTYDAGQYAIAGDGTFIYASGGSGDFGRLAFIEPNGKTDTLSYPRGMYRSIRITPDAQRIYTRLVDETGNWKPAILETGSNRRQDLNTQVFSRSRVVFRVLDDGSVLMGDVYTGATFRVPAETSSLQVIDSSKAFKGSPEWDVDPARTFIVHSLPSGRIAVNRMTGDTATLFLPEEEGGNPRISPDGHWIAYSTANLSIAVSPMPPTGASYQVSSESAEQPLWSPSGDALYFRQGRRIWKADLTTNNGFHVNSVNQVIDAPLIRIRGSSYDIARDGRLLVVLGTPEVSTPSLNVITGFGNRLNRLAPRK